MGKAHLDGERGKARRFSYVPAGLCIDSSLNRGSVCGTFVARNVSPSSQNNPASCQINLNKDLLQSTQKQGQKIER